MKHCPQCDFTFDDQEQVCDFDGSELITIPERPPSFKKVSFATESSGSFVRRLVTSRAGLIVLAPVVVLLSALLIGHFDSANQSNVDKLTSPTRDNGAMVPSTSVNTTGRAQAQAERQAEGPRNRPTSISTQRKIGPDELPPSMVKRLQAGTRSQSAGSRRNSPGAKPVATKRSSNSRLAATRRKPEKSNRPSQARNQSRPASQERVRQQHTVASSASRQSDTSNAYRRSDTSNAYRRSDASNAYRRSDWKASESSHHRKDPKVVAILKKTGRILKKPFDFIVDR